MPRPAAPAEPPWSLLPWLLLLAFALRAAVALSGDFVIHPDEIMQYLEPAHGLVFGNSVAYWEYYYGARSWLVPYAIAAVLLLCKVLGLGEPLYYIPAVKLALCALSVLIPLALYVLGRRLFDETTARLALLFGVFWYELVGFAHKPMTEFVATSLFFALMMLALRPRLTAMQAALASAFAVFVVAIRFQYAPLVGLVLLVPFVQSNWHTRLLMVTAAAVTLGAVGIFDKLTWGSFLQPYWFNFKVNLVLNQGRGEESSAWHYLGWPALASGGLFLLTLLGAGRDIRRRGFLLLLGLAVVLPHATQAHREYRFIFAMIPLWLLLCADLFARGWHTKATQDFLGLLPPTRMRLALAYAVLISGFGIANALPEQRWLYEAHSRESGYVNFLHGQDEIFSIYRLLAADDSVRGVRDMTRPYFNSGGYYYLHHKVPFYDGSIPPPPPRELSTHVSHFIAPPLTEIEQLVSDASGRLLLLTKTHGVLPLPQYVSDAALGKLVYWSDKGQPVIVNDFVSHYASDNFTVWKAEPPAPVRRWRTYRVHPDSEAMHDLVHTALGDAAKRPARNFGIEFAADDSAPDARHTQ